MSELHELHRLFFESVPFEAQRGIVRGIETAYRAAGNMCDESLHTRIRPQAWGYIRWLKVDSELLEVGERFGSAAQFELNTENTHIGHTELHFGERLMLTAASVPLRGRKPRMAAYREMLADSNQLDLFVSERVMPNKVWAVILHVPNVKLRKAIHIDIGFIAKDRTLAAPLLNLKHIVETNDVPAIETVPDLPLRKRAKVEE